MGHDPKKETGNFDFVFDNARLKGDISRYGSYPDISDIVLCDSAGTKSHWGIDLPYGVVKAELTTPEMIRPILGFGYRDRQWGDLLLQDWVKNWNWTYLANSALFSVVFDISSLNGERIYHAISGNERGIIRTAKPKMEPESSSVTSFAITLEKQIVIPNLLSASFALSPNNLMRSRINEEHPGFLANYLRWSVDAQASNGPQLNGIAEYMSIQRT